MPSEAIYCHELGRRSVARAALHLGIDGMSEEALDVVADTLLSYMKRVGKTMAKLVEASGRPSSHVNVLDALQAVRVCSSPSVGQLHLSGNDQDTGGMATEEASAGRGEGGNILAARGETNGGMGFIGNGRTSPLETWEDLASFCFGPKWFQTSTTRTAGSGGKSGPSSKAEGWLAAFREEVPPFPDSSPNCANPHRMQPSVSRSLHIDTEVPVKKEGGKAESSSAGGSKKRKQSAAASSGDNGGTDGTKSSRTSKRAKTEKTDSSTTVAAIIGKQGSDAPTNESHSEDTKTKADKPSSYKKAMRKPSFVPVFLPPYPEAAGSGRSVVDVPVSIERTMASGNILDVRASVVHLGQHQYWGSDWENDKMAVGVPKGRNASAAEPSAVVVPLGRASGSRVSRILEGSMDAVH